MRSSSHQVLSSTVTLVDSWLLSSLRSQHLALLTLHSTPSPLREGRESHNGALHAFNAMYRTLHPEP